MQYGERLLSTCKYPTASLFLQPVCCILYYILLPRMTHYREWNATTKYAESKPIWKWQVMNIHVFTCRKIWRVNVALIMGLSSKLVAHSLVVFQTAKCVHPSVSQQWTIVALTRYLGFESYICQPTVSCGNIYIYVPLCQRAHIYHNTYVYIYDIYIYIEREREGDLLWIRCFTNK